MTDEILPPASSGLGAWVRERLRDEMIAWLIAVDAQEVPQPNPVWFLWDGESILVYNLPSARRLVHIRRRPRVSLHLDSHGVDGDAIVLVGTALIVTSEPPADRQAAFLEKYSHWMDMGPADWAARFPIAIRIQPLHFRGFHNASPSHPGIT
jgi:PPOX class probable F420-dependent enzyme